MDNFKITACICGFKEKERGPVLTSKPHYNILLPYITDLFQDISDTTLSQGNMSTDSTSLSTCCYRFYYKRVTPNPHNPDLQGAPKLKRQKFGTESFEKCVQSRDPQCTYTTGSTYDLTIPYFCGHEEWCM